MTNKNFVIGVDVDNTICSLDSEWVEFMINRLHLDSIKEIKDFIMRFYSCDQYNMIKHLGRYYDYGVVHDAVVDFWDMEDLYDDCELYPGVINILSYWDNEVDCSVVLISNCKPAHKYSKLNFLSRCGLGKLAFIDTNDKHFVDVDIMIDDNPDVHRKFKKHNDKYVGVHFNAPFIKILSSTSDIKLNSNDWLEISNFIRYTYDHR